MKKKVLIVEDEAIIAIDICRSLKERGFEVADIVTSGEDAISAAGTVRPDIILMDLQLQGEMNGIDAAREITSTYNIPIIYITANSDDLTVAEATGLAPFGYILKPFDDRRLNIALELGMNRHKKELVLLKNERTIRALVNAIPEALLLLDDTYHIIALNGCMAAYLGNTVETLTGASVASVMPYGCYSVPLSLVDTVFSSGKAVHTEQQLGSQWFETHIYPVIEPEGPIHWIVVQSMDITRRKCIEEELKKWGLLQLEKNMEQFQILNDQIRNPLQVIRGYIELGNTPFRQEINRQIDLINDLVTRLDAGWLESEKVRTYLVKRDFHHPLYAQNWQKAGE